MSVRVRFAPSPTGCLHVGGARTALFNWLFARRNNGVFILRIEDTDLERSTAESEEGLLRDMQWLGLDWDEGPLKGGDYGPYRQSERKEVYAAKAAELLEKCAAYHCFCTEEELAARRDQAEQNRESLHYDGKCRDLPADDVAGRILKGIPHVIRLRVPEEDTFLDDIVRGRVEWKAETLGDFIIMRSNGMPVYNFCVVVDDATMKISHVIRAEEHLSNSHRQLILYRALGIIPPQFAHVSLILGPDKTKLSKRHGATSVGQYALDGYLPEAMINFLALLGWNEGNDREIYTIKELIAAYSLERICKSPAVFDSAKLSWMNGVHIRALAPAKLIELAIPCLQKAFPDSEALKDNAFAEKLVLLLQNHLLVFPDIEAQAKPILQPEPPTDPQAVEALEFSETPALLKAFSEGLLASDWNKDAINNRLKEAGKAAGAKGKKLFMPVRAALTGQAHGPDLIGIIELLGLQKVVQRLQR